MLVFRVHVDGRFLPAISVSNEIWPISFELMFDESDRADIATFRENLSRALDYLTEHPAERVSVIMPAEPEKEAA